MAVIQAGAANFEEEVLKSEKPVIVDFWATWCGPCRMLSPIVDELSEEHTEFKVCKINVDEEPALAAQFGVDTIPTLVILRSGKVLGRLIGFRPKAELLPAIERYLAE
jgi:thioredoxin 1